MSSSRKPGSVYGFVQGEEVREQIVPPSAGPQSLRDQRLSNQDSFFLKTMCEYGSITPQSRNIKHTPKTTGLELDLFIGSLIDLYWVWESDSSLGKSLRRLLSGSRSGMVAQSLSMGSILSPAWQGEHMCQAHCAKHTRPGIDRHPTSERTCNAFVLRGGGVMKTHKGTLPPTGVFSTVRSLISPCCWGWWWFIPAAHKAL